MFILNRELITLHTKISRGVSVIITVSVLIIGLSCSENKSGAYVTGDYPNLFVELLGKEVPDVNVKVNRAWNQLFYGDDQEERVFYPAGFDMAYIEDILHHDVRSEGMSYGMMIAVQLDKQEEFDRLWKWAKTYMQHKNGKRKGYFAWQVSTEGTILDPNPASDAEEYMVMSLFFAAARWGNGTGIYDYNAQAQAILEAMLSKEEMSADTAVIINMFNKKEKQVVFVPFGDAGDFTDPSYHLPHFYVLWSQWADTNQAFWAEAAFQSRAFFKQTAHPKTGLVPDYAHFNGSPKKVPWATGHEDFRFDAWRTIMNIAVDYVWFRREAWAVQQCNRWLDFFYRQGMNSYASQYTLDGVPLSEYRSPGLIAMNATACLASTHARRAEFVDALWTLPVPSGLYRYYDGLLYLLGLLHTSGQFQIYADALEP